MEEGHIHIQKTVRYFSSGECHPEGQLLIALHGYGQHPQFFLRKFEMLAGPQSCLLAPEGLHRFYTSGTSGRVGASWMTKEDRLNDIADNHAYLTALLATPPFHIPKRRVLLGFSQGAATAVRFFCADHSKFDRLILWAGSFPPDLSLPDNLDRLNEIGMDIAVGDQDEFIRSGDIQHVADLLDSAGVNYRLHPFSGKHELHVPTLKKILDSPR